MDGRSDEQILFHRTLPATARGPITVTYEIVITTAVSVKILITIP